MAKTDEYLDEAYQTLLTLSADEKKRLEYEAREKALKDYNTQMGSTLQRGLKRGEEIGLKRGEEIGLKRVNALNQFLASQGRTEDIIQASKDPDYQEKLMKEFGL